MANGRRNASASRRRLIGAINFTCQKNNTLQRDNRVPGSQSDQTRTCAGAAIEARHVDSEKKRGTEAEVIRDEQTRAEKLAATKLQQAGTASDDLANLALTLHPRLMVDLLPPLHPIRIAVDASSGQETTTLTASCASCLMPPCAAR